MGKEFNRILFWTFLGVLYGFAVGAISFAQTAILTPQGNYLCLPGSMVTTCAGDNGGFSVLPLGPQTYAITPMTPTMPYNYPSLDEPKQHRESSTPLFLMPSEAKPERGFEAETPKVPCYSLWKDC